MTTVLLNSKNLGSSGWVGVRRCTALKVEGMLDEDKLKVSFLNQEEVLFVDENGIFPLPVKSSHVRVEHVVAAVRNGMEGIYVDLVSD